MIYNVTNASLFTIKEKYNADHYNEKASRYALRVYIFPRAVLYIKLTGQKYMDL